MLDRLANAAVFASTTLGLTPHLAQTKYLLAPHRTKVLVGGRRSGKTTALAIETNYHAACAIRDGRRFKQLLVAPAVDQARIVFQAVSRHLRDSPLGGLIEAEIASPFPELRLACGGLVFVRAAHEGGRNLRGHSADRVVIDEAAYLRDHVVREAVMPILADSGGQLVLASTPTAKGSLFHSLYERGRQETDPAVAAFHMSSTENPHIDLEYVDAQRETVSDAQFAQEYLGEFVDQTGAVFRWENVLACTGEWDGHGLPNSTHVIGWDPAAQRDRSAVVVVNTASQPLALVHLEDLRGQDYAEQTDHVVQFARTYSTSGQVGDTRIVLDATGHGRVLEDMLRRQGAWVQGVTFTQTTKAEMVAALAVQIEKRQIALPHHPELLDELRFYEARTGPTGQVRYGAPDGRGHDDYVTALALAVAYGAGAAPRHRSMVEEGLPPFLTTSTDALSHDNATVAPAYGLPDDTWGSWT